MSAAGVRRQRRMVPLEYIAFEHNNAAAELVKLAYDTPPLAFVHSYGCQQNVTDGGRIKGVNTSRGDIMADRVGCVAAGNSSVLAKMAGLRVVQNKCIKTEHAVLSARGVI